jgi:hypothetical protein
MKTQTAFVGTDGRVKFHSVAPIHHDFSCIGLPRHAEGDDAFRFNHSFQDLRLLVFRMRLNKWDDRLGHFAHGL